MALWFESAWLPEGWRSGVRVTLDGARIASVEPDAEPQADDARHGALVPGLSADVLVADGDVQSDPAALTRPLAVLVRGVDAL